jgi:DNA replication and repair protein RecF
LTVHLSRLQLQAFRNYARADIQFSPGLNVIYGDNAQGKTNLLEAVYVLATGRSHRTSRDQELVSQGAEAALLRATVTRRTGELLMELTIGREARKTLKLNGIPERKIARLVGSMAVVFFSPDDLQLLKGPPAGRRRFLDIELCQISQTYLHHLARFNRVLHQRNILLRQPELEQAQLAVWDEQLLEAGAYLIARRAAAVARLAPLAAEFHRMLSAGREHLRMEYQSQAWKPGDDPESPAVRHRLAALLAERRREEVRRQVTLVGPHRDDIGFFIDGEDARLYASQGQQRTCVLALKLAELRFMQEEIGESPILLLDDVASELDPHRRQYLLRAVDEGVQTFLSCTDLESLSADSWPAVHRRFCVRTGTLYAEEER